MQVFPPSFQNAATSKLFPGLSAPDYDSRWRATKDQQNGRASRPRRLRVFLRERPGFESLVSRRIIQQSLKSGRAIEHALNEANNPPCTQLPMVKGRGELDDVEGTDETGFPDYRHARFRLA